MGYTLTIGEAEFYYDSKDRYISFDAKYEEHEGCPMYGDKSEGGNSRSPGYSVWHDFARHVGLEEFFYGQGSGKPCSDNFYREFPILHEHPGAAVINQEDADYVTSVYKEYMRKNPNAIPGYTCDPSNNPLPNLTGREDPWLVRLVWLEYWMQWAVKNCKHPIFYNS